MQDEDYMRLALSLAQKGIGQVGPNPMVGAVIVQNGKVIGKGWHQTYGGPHAERNAIASCKEKIKGATLYVTLEPCCHTGKTPPCTDAILEIEFKRVVIGSSDPNPQVANRSVKILQHHGITVTKGVLKQECDMLNKVFFHFIQTKTPYVIIKYAMTMDGKMATISGLSRWITGDIARQRVHEDRHRYSAIMVGIGTLLIDDPLLTCRLPDGKNPIRIICDTNLRTPLKSQIIKTAYQVRTIIATSCTDALRHQIYEAKGCEILLVSKQGNHLNLTALMKQLGAKKIDSILLEGGSTLNGSALDSGIVNKIQTYIGSKIFGGIKATSPVGGKGIKDPQHAYQLTKPTITPLGDDILLESEVLSCSQEL